jgi:hypothetical protein
MGVFIMHPMELVGVVVEYFPDAVVLVELTAVPMEKVVELAEEQELQVDAVAALNIMEQVQIMFQHPQVVVVGEQLLELVPPLHLEVLQYLLMDILQHL